MPRRFFIVAVPLSLLLAACGSLPDEKVEPVDHRMVEYSLNKQATEEASRSHKGLKPPYVLVGHSLGGLYMQFFARRYPDEVAALVLVDATHPSQFKDKGDMQNWPGWVRVGFRSYLSSAAKDELDAISATGEAVLALPTLSGKPVIVLSALMPMEEKSELANDANEKRKEIARLYPGSRQVWVDSGHGIPLDRPDAVIAAVREAVSAIASK